MINLEHLLAGRTMALERSALPALAAMAQMRAGNMALEDVRQMAGAFGREPGTVAASRRAGVSIVPLSGIVTTDALIAWLLGGTNPDALVRTLQAEVADPAVASIVLLVDSPGGEVSLLPETAAEIRRLRALKPITAIARVQMCSAAYWLASQASRIVATPSATVGSVGVFLMHAESSRLLDAAGVTVTYVASDPRKVEANPHEPLSDDAMGFLQRGVDDCFAAFINDIALGRGQAASRIRTEFGSGRAFGAKDALRMRMVDEIGTLESLLASAATGQRSSTRALTGQAQVDLDVARAKIAQARATLGVFEERS